MNKVYGLKKPVGFLTAGVQFGRWRFAPPKLRLGGMYSYLIFKESEGIGQPVSFSVLISSFNALVIEEYRIRMKIIRIHWKSSLLSVTPSTCSRKSEVVAKMKGPRDKIDLYLSSSRPRQQKDDQ